MQLDVRDDTSGSTNGLPPLRIFALGAFRLFVGDREVQPAEWKSRKAELVLKYLLTQRPGRPLAREVVMEALWPKRPAQLGDQNLRTAISALRRVLEPDLPPRLSSAYIHCKGGRCILNLGSQGYFDVDEFTKCVTRATQLEREGHHLQAAALYEGAVDVYQGDLLEDELYAEWAFSLRQRLSDMYATALVRLGTWRLQQGEYSQAIDLARRALDVDPVLEPSFRLMIAGYARGGQWSSVRRVYDRYSETMKEYELVPPPDLRTVLAECSPQSVRQPPAP